MANEAELRALLAEARKKLCDCKPGEEVADESNGCTTCNICARITAALAEKDDGGWAECSVLPEYSYFLESYFQEKPLVANVNGKWYAHKPLPPLPTERKV